MIKNKIIHMVRIAILSAIAVSLSYIKFKLPTGGSINLCATPILISSLKYGLTTGAKVAVTTAVLRLILGSRIFHPLSIFLDYIFSYACLSFCGIIYNKNYKNVILGILFSYLLRFFLAVISGYIIFSKILSKNQNPWIYSITSNLLYLIPNFLINTTAVLLLSRFYSTKNKFQ